MTKSNADTILKLLDAGHTPVQIIASLADRGITKRVVYTVLRRERPGRARAPRTRVSTVPAQVRALHAAGLEVKRIATLMEVTNVYVYRILAEK